MRTIWSRIVLMVAAFVVFCVPTIRANDEPAHAAPWASRAIDLYGSLPVQDGGRIKPLSTYASFTLLRIAGKRSADKLTGGTSTPVEWLLDVTLFPEDAARDPIFLVQDSDAITAIGVSIEGKKKRDRWSYEVLQPGLPRLFALAHDYDSIEAKDRTTLQQQVVDLAGNVLTFLRLARFLDFARGGDPADGDALALIPPVAGDARRAEWLTPGELIHDVGPNAPVTPDHAGLIALFEALVAQRDAPEAFEHALETLNSRLVALAEARGEYEHIALERAYYAANPIVWSLVLYIAAFIGASVLWLRPRVRIVYAGVSITVLAAALLLIAAIAVRCAIRERPPVSTLYETVLFVTACGSLVALFLEYVHRSRIAISAAAILGTIGLFVANGYETLDKQDTMPSLVAVLDTNFWLATHVTAITIGYSAGMLAALLATIYLIGKLCGWKRGEPAFHRDLSRMVYGVLCFAMIFSTVGTILGGIWANESWGRFWGWDPKENGALLIVISQIAILHARRGGYLREHGTCMAAAFGGTVIAFSWWGVNLLGVGLHSYGFTSGIHTGLWTYYALQWSVVASGAFTWWRERASARSSPARPLADSISATPGRDRAAA